MDAPYYNGEPGALPSDPEWDERRDDSHDGLSCSDCAAEWSSGFCSSPTGKVFCWDCRVRRGFRFLFDARSWAVIEADLRKGAA